MNLKLWLCTQPFVHRGRRKKAHQNKTNLYSPGLILNQVAHFSLTVLPRFSSFPHQWGHENVPTHPTSQGYIAFADFPTHTHTTQTLTHTDCYSKQFSEPQSLGHHCNGHITFSSVESPPRGRFTFSRRPKCETTWYCNRSSPRIICGEPSSVKSILITPTRQWRLQAVLYCCKVMSTREDFLAGMGLWSVILFNERRRRVNPNGQGFLW